MFFTPSGWSKSRVLSWKALKRNCLPSDETRLTVMGEGRSPLTSSPKVSLAWPRARRKPLTKALDLILSAGKLSISLASYEALNGLRWCWMPVWT